MRLDLSSARVLKRKEEYWYESNLYNTNTPIYYSTMPIMTNTIVYNTDAINSYWDRECLYYTNSINTNTVIDGWR